MMTMMMMMMMMMMFADVRFSASTVPQSTGSGFQCRPVS